MSPAGQQHRQLIDGGFPLDGEAVVLLNGVDVPVTAGYYLPKVCERHPELFEHAAIKLLEVLVKSDAPQPVGDVQDLSQTHGEEREAPQERVRGARVRPRPQSGAEKAQGQEGEQVEEAVKATAAHKPQEEEDVGEVEDGALGAVSPLLTQRVSGRRRHRREVQGVNVWKLHVHEQRGDI